MDRSAPQAVATIRRCVEGGRMRLTMPFRVRLAERGVLWVDVLTVIDQPAQVEADGYDDTGRARWIVHGEAADGTEIGLVCAIGRDEEGELTVFVTAFWED